MGVVRGRTVRSLRRDGAEVLGVPDLESSEPVSARIQPLVPAAPPMPLRLGQQEPMSQAMHRRSDDQEGLTHLDWVNEDLPRLGHENLIEHCRLSTRWGVDGQLHEERPARRPASSHLAGKSLKYLAAQR
jgi:hypothetical protein